MSKQAVKGKRHWVKNIAMEGRAPEYPDCQFAVKPVCLYVRCGHPDHTLEICSSLHMRFRDGHNGTSDYHCPLNHK